MLSIAFYAFFSYFLQFLFLPADQLWQNCLSQSLFLQEKILFRIFFLLRRAAKAAFFLPSSPRSPAEHFSTTGKNFPLIEREEWLALILSCRLPSFFFPPHGLGYTFLFRSSQNKSQRTENFGLQIHWPSGFLQIPSHDRHPFLRAAPSHCRSDLKFAPSRSM